MEHRIRIAVVDDELSVAEFLCRKTKSFAKELNMEVTTDCLTSGYDLLKRHRESPYQMVLLDLEMPEMDGLTAAKELRRLDQSFVLIFITNRADLVFRAFEYEVTGFIRKNYVDEELKDVLDRAFQKILARTVTYVLKTDKGERILHSDSICYILSKGHQIFVFDEKQSSTRILSSLNMLEEMLSPLYFVRCHSGIIVNVQYIYSINKDSISLTNGQILPLSRGRAKSVKEIFQKALRSV